MWLKQTQSSQTTAGMVSAPSHRRSRGQKTAANVGDASSMRWELHTNTEYNSRGLPPIDRLGDRKKLHHHCDTMCYFACWGESERFEFTMEKSNGCWYVAHVMQYQKSGNGGYIYPYYWSVKKSAAHSFSCLTLRSHSARTCLCLTISRGLRDMRRLFCNVFCSFFCFVFLNTNGSTWTHSGNHFDIIFTLIIRITFWLIL